jgi:hypothetical protein
MHRSPIHLLVRCESNEIQVLYYVKRDTEVCGFELFFNFSSKRSQTIVLVDTCRATSRRLRARTTGTRVLPVAPLLVGLVPPLRV